MFTWFALCNMGCFFPCFFKFVNDALLITNYKCYEKSISFLPVFNEFQIDIIDNFFGSVISRISIA